MYAIVEVGAKQYNVKKGDIITVEKQAASRGKEFVFNKVLLVSKERKVEIGQPYVKGASVSATVLSQMKAKKVFSFKYRPRKAWKWQKGHRQKLTQLKIMDIKTG